jgi:sugar O-acyltransferase (sialic acid O-acetyltransferase NeuD family)
LHKSQCGRDRGNALDMAEIVIFGASMSAEVAKAFLDAHTGHRVVGFTVDPAYVTSDRFCGLPLVRWDRLEEVFPPDRVELLGPVSYRLMNEFRRDRFFEGRARHYRFASFIHPKCLLYDNEIGEHCFIGPSIIEPGARIGNNVIIWGGSYIAHHCVIGDHTFISGLVGVSGGTRIGERCFLGGQVCVSEGLTIGDGCLLSIGSLVTRDLPPNSVVRRGADDKIAPFPSSRVRRML